MELVSQLTFQTQSDMLCMPQHSFLSMMDWCVPHTHSNFCFLVPSCVLYCSRWYMKVKVINLSI